VDHQSPRERPHWNVCLGKVSVRCLTENPAEERAALLGDLTEMLFVRRSVDRGREANVTHDVFAVGETLDRPEDEDGREGRQQADARVREEQGGTRIGTGGGGDLSVEMVDPHRQPPQQLEIVIATAGGVTGKGERFEGGAPMLRPKLRGECQAMVQSNGLKAILHHGSHPDEADPVGNEGAEVTSVGIGDPHTRETIVSGLLFGGRVTVPQPNPTNSGRPFS
jgi:hypothetical protein